MMGISDQRKQSDNTENILIIRKKKEQEMNPYR